MKNIAIQGIAGSFHDIAARTYFSDEEIELCCCDSFEELFRHMREDEDLLALAAIENTIAGSLLRNYELLRQSGVTIVGEQKLHIKHSIACLPDEGWDDLSEVNSHPVALQQCRDFLSAHPGLKVVETDDTAAAAARISREGLRGHAAICHAEAARAYGLRVLEEKIEDNKHNYTRFLVLANPQQADSLRDTEASNKASLVFSLPHSAGSLSQVLSIFSFYQINLTKIQSLPIIGHEWEYLFYIDVSYTDFHRYRQSIDAVRPLTSQLTILGEYEAC